jgi:hypothetical protein
MPMETRSDNRMRLIPLCLLLLILMIACGSKDQFIGTYKADAKDSPKQAEIILELKADGAGIWRVGDEEVPFSWYVKGGELRVNTRGGGVIVGASENDTIRITLPGSETLSFKKFQ